ncbi:TPA: hypothetical protein ND827_005011 [Klebsiella pneumoniae]|nr:hypothetical protein [Klebsiella pneumoniae]HCD8454353.1 hypothetical protein [Klebsiella pneumoniae]
MSHLPIPNHGCTLTEAGESRLLRTALASEFLADILLSGSKTVSAEGAAAIMACIADQLEGVVRETSTMKGDSHER